MKTTLLTALLLAASATHTAAARIVLVDDLLEELRTLEAPGPDGVDGATFPDVLQADVIRGIELANQTGNPASLASFTVSGGLGTLSLTGANAGEGALLSIHYIAFGDPLDLDFPGGPTVEIQLAGAPVGEVLVEGFYADTDGNRGVWKAPANGASTTIHLLGEHTDPVDFARIRETQIDIRLQAMSDAGIVIDSIRFVPEPTTGLLVLLGSAVLARRGSDRRAHRRR